MAETPLKPRLLELLGQAHANQLELLKDLSDEERDATGTPQRWSAKDLIAHIAAWEQRQVVRLEALAQGENPPRFDDFDRLNAQTFEEHRQRSWLEILDEAERAFGELANRLQDFSEEDLTDPQRFAGLNGRPLWQQIIFNSYWHTLDHLARYYFDHGDQLNADQIQEKMAEELSRLDNQPAWQGNTRYNLACFYAVAGQPAKAVPLLREALLLNPGLTDWSKQDSDLDSLRQDPAYQELYSKSIPPEIV